MTDLRTFNSATFSYTVSMPEELAEILLLLANGSDIGLVGISVQLENNVVI